MTWRVETPSLPGSTRRADAAPTAPRPNVQTESTKPLFPVRHWTSHPPDMMRHIAAVCSAAIKSTVERFRATRYLPGVSYQSSRADASDTVKRIRLRKAPAIGDAGA
jgi:hypothetical protein